MVIVEIGPASDIGIPRFSEKRVGNQFLVAHPGRLDAAKYSRMTQNAPQPISFFRLVRTLSLGADAS